MWPEVSNIVDEEMAAYGNSVPGQFVPQRPEKSSLQAAAEAAAKVNAMLIAKGKLRPNQVHNNQQNQKKGNTSSMVAAEVEINDAPLSMRNMLTRGPTQEEITKFSGAAVSTRGRYMTPQEKMKNNTGERPLYLYVQGPSQDSVNVAVQRINEILMGSKGGGPTGGGLVRTSAPPPPQQQPPSPAPGQGLLPVPAMQMPPVHQPPPMLAAPVQPPELQQMTVVEEKLYIGLEHAPPSFDVKNKIMGPGGSYLMHIQTETGAKVMLRGKGSGFIEPNLGREAFEPMHIHIQHPTILGLQQAKQLAENLIQTVQQTYANFQQVLASLPPAVAPAPSAYITGIQQPTSLAEAALMAPPPGLPTITALQDQQLVQSAPGLQPTQTVIVPSSSMSSVIVPAGSIASSLSAINPGQPGAPGVMLPTTMSIAPVPVVSTLPISSQTHIIQQAPPGALELGQQQLIMNQGPPPQPMAQVNLGPPMSAQTSLPASMAPLVSMPAQLAPQVSFPALQPTMQIVSQPAPAPAPPGLAPPGSLHAPAPGQPPPYQTIYTPEAVSSGPAFSPVPSSFVISSSPSSLIYSVATTSSVVTNTPTKDTEPTRRRFTEEKDDKIPENLLGYQHGPPHLVNLVCPSPPPGQAPPGLPPGQPALMQPQGQPSLPASHTLQPAQPTQVTVMGQPAQPQLQVEPPQLQPGQHPVPPGHPGIATSFALQPGLQVQTVHAIPAHLGPPPAGVSAISQPYPGPPPSSIADDGRFGMIVSSAGELMPPPPPPASSHASNGDVGHGYKYPPPARSEAQWGSGTGTKRGVNNNDRSSEHDSDRKRRKKNTNDEGDEDNGGQSPSVQRDQRESPKPGTPTQGHGSRSQNYSPLREPSSQDGEPGPQLPPPPPPQHQPAYQQFEITHSLPQHLVHPGPAGPHMAAGPPPFDPQVQPPPPPPHQQFIEHATQPPPPPIQYQEVGQQFSHLATLPPHSQPELVGVPVSQPLPNHSGYPAFSQPGPPSHFISSPAAASSHSTYSPAPQFIHQPRLQHPPPPPPPPASQQYHPGHAPPQGFWHG